MRQRHVRRWMTCATVAGRHPRPMLDPRWRDARPLFGMHGAEDGHPRRKVDLMARSKPAPVGGARTKAPATALPRLPARLVRPSSRPDTSPEALPVVASGDWSGERDLAIGPFRDYERASHIAWAIVQVSEYEALRLRVFAFRDAWYVEVREG